MVRLKSTVKKAICDNCTAKCIYYGNNGESFNLKYPLKKLRGKIMRTNFLTWYVHCQHYKFSIASANIISGPESKLVSMTEWHE